MPGLVKVNASTASAGPEGEVRLAAGQRMAMRMWRNEEPTADKPPRSHDYEVVGYALSGLAELDIEGETVELRAGDSWVVPAGATHTYRIRETFSAVEVMSKPAAESSRG